MVTESESKAVADGRSSGVDNEVFAGVQCRVNKYDTGEIFVTRGFHSTSESHGGERWFQAKAKAALYSKEAAKNNEYSLDLSRCVLLLLL